MTTPSTIGRRTAHQAGPRWHRRRAGATTRARAEPARGEDRAAGAAVRPLGASGHPEADGRRAGDRRREQGRRHQGARRRQDEAGPLRHRRHRGEGQERRSAPGGAGARRGRRHGVLAVQLHAGGDRGDRARGAAVAHAVLLRPDHRTRLQVRLPVVPDRRGPGHRAAAAGRRPGDQGREWAADEGGLRRRQLGLLGQLHEGDPRRRGEGPGPHDRGRRDLTRRRWPTRRRSSRRSAPAVRTSS